MAHPHDNRPQSSFSNLPREPFLPSQQNTKTRRLRRQILLILAGCLTFSIVTFCLANLVTSLLLQRELIRVMQNEEPLRLDALGPAPLPDAQNAAVVYMRAAAALSLTQAESDQLRDNPLTEANANLLTKNQTALRLTREAAQIPGCRFSIDYNASNLAGILLPHLPKMRQLANLARVQALREARQGQIDAALNDTAVLFRMSEHIAPEPILISGLTSIAIERMGYKTLAFTLNQRPLSAAEARAFAQRLPQTDWTDALHHDLQGERCFGLWAFQYVSNPLEAKQLLDGPYTLHSNLFSKGLSLLWSPLWKMDEVQYLRVQERQSRAILKPGVPMISDTQITKDLPWYAVCTRIMLPTLARVGAKRDEMLTYRRLAQTALALSARRATRGGHYPDNLSEAQAAWGEPLPRDLFTEQSFRYRVEGGKALLYSVGPNHKDEGGEKARNSSDGASGEGTAQNKDDLVWGE